MPSGSHAEVLVWETGLSRLLGDLEEDLIRWHQEERSKAEIRQAPSAQTGQEVAAVEAALREASFELPEDQPWHDRLSSLLQSAKEQRRDLNRICKLLREHAKAVEAGELLDQLPEEGKPYELAADDMQRLTGSFLKFADKQPAEGLPEDEEDEADEAEREAGREVADEVIHRPKKIRRRVKREVPRKKKEAACCQDCQGARRRA